MLPAWPPCDEARLCGLRCTQQKITGIHVLHLMYPHPALDGMNHGPALLLEPFAKCAAQASERFFTFE